MNEFVNNYYYIIALYFPLGIIGLWRWTIWLQKKIAATYYVSTKPNNFDTTLSVITPVYNEEPDVFLNALESWKENNPNEIIAVIDYTDKSSIAIFKMFSEKFLNAKLVITKKPGKRPALADGAKIAKSEIVALVDSDAIWDKDMRFKILAPFIDLNIGGVGTRQRVLNPNTLARKLFNIHLNQRYFLEMPFIDATNDAHTCLSGRTAIYRKKALLPVLDNMVDETFLGEQCISGEDKCLTRLIQSNGWKTCYQKNACISTPGARDILTFLKQQIRWARNSWRSDIKSLFSKWIWREKTLALYMIDRFTQPFTLIIGPIYFILAIIKGHWIIVFILLIWWHLSRFIKIYPYLKQKSLDIFILPYYIFHTYMLGVIKIYCFFTIKTQGWITRWDKNRLIKSKFFKLVPAYAGTIAILVLLVVFVHNYKQAFAVNSINFLNNNTIEYPEIYRQKILKNLEEKQFGYLTIKKSDTLSEIARMFNANVSDLRNQKFIVGSQIKIPVSSLRNTLTKEQLQKKWNKLSKITFDSSSNTINVTGDWSMVTIPDIYYALRNEKILQKLNRKEWLLKSNLFIGENVALIIDGKEVLELKLESNKDYFVTLITYGGNILISNTKITSWDHYKNSPDIIYKDGRSFVLAKYSGRMDVLNSEIAYLGYRGFPKQGQPIGGLYGISWKIPNDTFGEYLITGNIINNKIHHNYFGVYTYGATGMTIRNNEFYNNIKYGLDPHDDSNNLIIENNKAYNNGSHGIIISKRCVNNVIRNNMSYNNNLHGIMLDRQSNNNLVEGNILYGNTDGIAIYNSHNNLVRNNKIRENKNSGIRANIFSSGNYFEMNEIFDNTNGIFLYNSANNNLIVDNSIYDNKIGIYIKNSVDNFIKNSLKAGDNKRDIKYKSDY